MEANNRDIFHKQLYVQLLKNYDNDMIVWNGTTLGGKEATSGTYFYQIEMASTPWTYFSR